MYCNKRALLVDLRKVLPRLSRSKRLRESNKISEEEFVNLLEKEKVKVDKLLTAMVSDPGTRTPSNILKSRSTDLYDSVMRSSNLARLINDVRNREKNGVRNDKEKESQHSSK